jgi:hypothetical protein
MCKAKFSLKYAKSVDAVEFVRYVCSSKRFSSDMWVEVMDNASLKDKVFETKKDLSSDPSRLDEELTSAIKDHISKTPPDEVRDKYVSYMESRLKLPYNIDPKVNYKAVGTNAVLAPDILGEWDRLSMLCVFSERMRLLKESEYERLLVAAMMPRCVIECSKYDDSWAIKIPNKEEANTLLSSNFNFMIDRIYEQVGLQETFVRELAQYADKPDYVQQALDMLCFNFGSRDIPSHERKRALGLSEKLIQSVWLGELSFSDDLKRKLEEKLRPYGIQFHYYDPTLEKTNHTCFEIACSIGKQN